MCGLWAPSSSHQGSIARIGAEGRAGKGKSVCLERLMVCFGDGLSGVDVSSEGVLLDDAVYVVKLAAAFPIAKTQAACLQILIPLDQLNLAAGINATAGFSYLYPICK